MLRTFCRSLSREATRSFSSAASETVQLPLKQFGVPGRYAGALYVAATKAGSLHAVEKELAQVDNLTYEVGGLDAFLKDPSMGRLAKSTAVREILSDVQCSEITKNFFGLMAENGRLGEYEKVLEKFTELMQASRGEVKAVYTSAEVLTDEQLQAATQSCRKLLKEGETLVLETQVDESILDGFVVEIGDKYIDQSASTKLKKLQALLAQAI